MSSLNTQQVSDILYVFLALHIGDGNEVHPFLDARMDISDVFGGHD